MPLPPKTVVGERLTSKWVNNLRAEVKANRIIESKGMRFDRGDGGTILNNRRFSSQLPFVGTEVNVINLTGDDFQQWWWLGVEEVTNRDNMQENVSIGVDYILRKPEAQYNDFPDRMVMLAEPIKYNEAGTAYMSSEIMVARVRYAEDGSEDHYRYANIDTTAEDNDLYLPQAAPVGNIAVIDLEEDTTDHSDEPEWRWCIVRFPANVGLPQLWQATADAADNVIPGKRQESEGDLVGDDQDFFAFD